MGLKSPDILRVRLIGGRSAACWAATSVREGTTIVSKRHHETLRRSIIANKDAA